MNQCPGNRELTVIREHLYKKHMVRTHCYRCFATFKNEEELEHHARQEPQCEKCDKPAEQMIGVTKIAKEKLKARTSLSALSDVDKWKHIYGIVFPEVKSEDVPSPCK
jgi:NAD-dependent SIR2 family protein deacetylase